MAQKQTYRSVEQNRELRNKPIHILIANFRLKKVGRTTRPFRYDLNQIPYDHTVEMKIDSRG